MNGDRADDDYRTVLGSIRGPKGPLRRGLTTGSWAQAAVKAAAEALLGNRRERVRIELPPGNKAWSGKTVSVPVRILSAGPDEATAAVVKDAGDDADITNGAEIRAVVRRRDDREVSVRGGRGVGRVSRPGLPVAVGEAAINPVPRTMIARELKRLGGGFDALIEIPDGAVLAAKTWNPRIGVEGGLSVIGTSGVVEPASSSAFRRTLYRTAKAFAARGEREIAITPGYVGERYLKKRGAAEDRTLVVGDHIGFALDACAKLGFTNVALAAHAGKAVKIAAGLFNTHSKYGDARLETLAACAGAAGADAALVSRVLSLKLAEEAIPILAEAGFADAFALVARRAAERSAERCGLPVSCAVLDLAGNELAVWPPPRSGAENTEPGLVVVGMGPGPAEFLLPAARGAIAAADIWAGDERHLAAARGIVSAVSAKREIPFGGGVEAFLDRVDRARRNAAVALLVSGDPCLYSLRAAAERRFGAGPGTDGGIRTVPGLSAFQLLAARADLALDDAELLSVHGRPLETLDRLRGDRTAVVFADGSNTPAAIARRLLPRFGPARRAVAGERLGYADERVADLPLAELAETAMGGLSIVIVPADAGTAPNGGAA